MTEKSTEHEHVEDKADEKTQVFFAKELDFSFERLDGLTSFFESLREFSHHLSENHYYSESINKRVMSATLELHSISLELHEIGATVNQFYSTVHKAILAETKPIVNQKQFGELKQRFAAAEQRVFDLSASLKKLVDEIKREYGEKV